MWTEWRLKEWPFYNFLIWRVIGDLGRIIDFDHFLSLYMYRNPWSIKTIMLFFSVPYCILAFLMILSLSLYTSHGYHVDKSIISFFGFSRNLREFCAIIQSSLRASVTGTHRCDEESILWRNAGGSLSLIIKEFMTFVCFWNNPLEVLQGLVGWYLVDSML